MEAEEIGNRSGGEAPRIITFDNSRTGAGSGGTGQATLSVGNPPQLLIRKKQPAGPQLWAVICSIGGLYYLWTRVLGRAIHLPQRGHSIKGRSDTTTATDAQTARERRLAALENANANLARDKFANLRERTNVNNSGTITLEQRQKQNQLNMEKQQKQQEIEEKKKKQRLLYLRQKALKDKEEEEKKKDEELGPGWRAREDPSIVSNLLEKEGNNGGYKAPSCTKRGG